MIFFVDLNLLVFLIGLLNEHFLHSNDNTLYMSVIKIDIENSVAHGATRANRRAFL